MDKGRLEAFTDGIIAIAITIMVLELKVPDIAGVGDWSSLLPLSSTFIAYLISFMMVASAWYSHHNLLLHAEKLTAKTYLANMLWVFTVTLFPFVTAWVGDAPMLAVPSFFYAFDQLLCQITFALLRYRVISDNPGMKHPIVSKPLQVFPFALFIVCICLIPLWSPISLCATFVGAIVNYVCIVSGKATIE